MVRLSLLMVQVERWRDPVYSTDHIRAIVVRNESIINQFIDECIEIVGLDKTSMIKYSMKAAMFLYMPI